MTRTTESKRKSRCERSMRDDPIRGRVCGRHNVAYLEEGERCRRDFTPTPEELARWKAKRGNRDWVIAAQTAAVSGWLTVIVVAVFR